MNAFVTAAGGVLPQPRTTRTRARCGIRMNFRPSGGASASGSGGVNAGEEYIRQLARQSAENHERRFGNTARESEPIPSGHNAGEEYIRQLSNQTAGRREPRAAPGLTPEQQQRMEAMRAASAAAANADTPARRIVDGADAARERILAELQALDLETDAAPDAGTADEAPPNINTLDSQIAALEAKLAAARQPAPAAPKSAPAPAPTPAPTAPADQAELEQMRMGMIEMRMETERYANEVRKLQEKHEQMMRVIIDKYMPGL